VVLVNHWHASCKYVYPGGINEKVKDYDYTGYRTFKSLGRKNGLSEQTPECHRAERRQRGYAGLPPQGPETRRFRRRPEGFERIQKRDHGRHEHETYRLRNAGG